MKILHVIQALNLGGAARSMIATAKYAPKSIHKTISLLPALPEAVSLAKEAGMEVLSQPDRPRILQEMESADIVHVNFWNNCEVYDLLRSSLPPMRLLMWYHICGNGAPQIITQKLMNFSDVNIASNPFTYENLTVFKKTHEGRKAMVYDATDFNRLEGIGLKDHDHFNVGYMGTVNFVKMHHNYVPMSAGIRIPDVRFVVCGGGAENLLKQQALKLGAQDKFEFKGYVIDVKSMIETFDVFGYPLCENTYASAELTLQEVMYAGVPPVVFPYGGIRQLVIHEKTGLVVHSEKEYQAAIEELYQNPEKRKRLGENAAKYARDVFGAENAAQAIEPVYQRLMEQPKRKRLWGQKVDLSGIHPDLSYQEKELSGAEIFIESLGKESGPFIASMCSQDEEADRLISESSHLLCFVTGGIVHYRERFPNDPYLRLWTGLILHQNKRFEEAMCEFSAAINLGLSDWRCAWYLARSAKMAGDMALFHKILDRIKTANPMFVMEKDLETNHRIEALIQEQRHQEAMDLIKEALKTDPDSPDLKNYEAEVEFQFGDLNRGKALLRELVQKHPQHPKILNNMGVICWAEGDSDKAVYYFTQSLNMDPNDRFTVLNMGDILNSKGEYAQEQELYSRYLKGNPNDKEILDKVYAQEKKTYKVSAVISVYNSENFIRGCLQNLVDQTLFKKDQLQIVAVNGGSQENEEAIIHEFQSKYSNIKYIKCDQRETIYSAWAMGSKAADGEYVANTNTDDRLRNDALEIMANTLDNHQDAGIVYINQIMTKHPNETFENHHRDKLMERYAYSKEVIVQINPCGPQVMWRKKLHDLVGYFNPEYEVAGDWEFWLRVVFNTPYTIRHVPEFLGLYHYNTDGLELGGRKQKERLKEIEGLRAKYGPLVRK